MKKAKTVKIKTLRFLLKKAGNHFLENIVFGGTVHNNLHTAKMAKTGR